MFVSECTEKGDENKQASSCEGRGVEVVENDGWLNSGT